MRVPDFLVIGGMKCGTTTLHHDLARHASIVLAEKECNALTKVNPSYRRQFRSAGQKHLCGDVSTTYSMFPDVAGVPERARKLLSTDAKIIFVIREPVQRAISHHWHYQSLVGRDRMDGAFDECVTRYPSLVNFSRYALQLRQWLEYWPITSLKIVRFEDYVTNRRETLNELCQFLHIQPYPEHASFDRTKNASHGKPVLTPTWARLALSEAYRSAIRPWLPSAARERIARALLPQAPPAPAPPGAEVVNALIHRFAADAADLQTLTGRSAPYWDFEAVRLHFLQRRKNWDCNPPFAAA